MDAILSLLALIGLGWLVYGPWQDACTDFARQRIFANRDKLFDLASEERISFESKIYKTIRLSLESNIRFAHMLTLPRMIFYRLMLRDRFTSGSSARQAIERIEDPDLRATIEGIVKDSQITLLAMVLMKSPLFLFLIPVFAVAYWNHKVGSRIYKHFAARAGRWGEVVQLEAENAPTSALNPI